MSRASFLLCSLGLLAASAPALAADRVVIQNRQYGLNHEFTLQVGVLPLDVLYKAPTITGRYTWHINDFVAWEALSITYAPTTDLSLLGIPLLWGGRLNHFSAQGNELQDNFGYGPFDVDQFRVMAESNIVLKPLYGKFSMFNRSNARVELYWNAGIAAANFVSYNPYPFDPIAQCARSGSDPTCFIPAIPTTPQGFLPEPLASYAVNPTPGETGVPVHTFVIRPGADIGGGLRFMASRRVTLRVDGRAYGFFEGFNYLVLPPRGPEATRTAPVLPLAFTPLLYVGAAVAVSLGG